MNKAGGADKQPDRRSGTKLHPDNKHAGDCEPLSSRVAFARFQLLLSSIDYVSKNQA
jgi:hypothetical protein